MKIAMFTNTYLPFVGGLEKSIETFATAMRAMGHQVLVVAPQYRGASSSCDKVFRVPALKGFAGSPYSIKLSIPGLIASRIKKFAPDIIHSHQPFLLGDSALREAKTLDIPIVYTNHTFMERYLHWFPVDWEIIRKVAEKLPSAYANLVDHVITPTESVAQILRARNTHTPITSIPTGIDADFYGSGDRAGFRKQYDIGERDFVIGHLGRLNPEKNLSYLADVALRVVDASAQNRRFLLVGEGGSVAAIKQLFESRGLQDRLICTGVLQGQACADAYAAMDVFLFTSLSDTQGLVMSEAMAAANPVFALRAPGAQDLVRHEGNGILLDADQSSEQFAQEMNRRIATPGLLQQLGQQARKDAYEVSISASTERVLGLYEELIEQKNQQRGVSMPTFWNKLVKRWEIERDLMHEKFDSVSD